VPSRRLDPVRKAVEAKRESKHLDFKASFDSDSAQDWCEVTKDIVAMANSGGGLIVVGVSDNGRNSGADVSSFASVDPAVITLPTSTFTTR
jgi:predicted HTH transcriptional regulator